MEELQQMDVDNYPQETSIGQGEKPRNSFWKKSQDAEQRKPHLEFFQQ